MNCKRLQQSIANCVSCVHALNEKVLREQKAKEIAQIKRLNSSVGDICRWVYAKIGTQSGPRSAGVIEGMGCRRDPLPQLLSSPVPRSEGDRRPCSLLQERAGDLRWEERGEDEELRATEGERVQK